MDQSDFKSPSKRKDGVIEGTPSRRRSTRSSPTKTGVSRGIITATPLKNGRAGMVSPLKRSNTDLDRSARKRAITTSYNRMMESDSDSDYDDDMSLAEKIIEASKKDGGAPILHESEGEDEDDEKEKMKFVPTPVPKKGEPDFLLEKKFDDRALFLDGFEGFFEQHKTKVKTSGNTMSQLVELEYEEYLRNVKLCDLIQQTGQLKLWQMHRDMFPQWYYELLQGFNLCFYGVGSKRDLCLEFVQDFLLPRLDGVECCVVNGYNPEVSIKEVLSMTVPILLPNYKQHKLPKNSRELVNYLSRTLPKSSRPFLDLTKPPKLILLVNNIDGKQLKEPLFQSVLGSLAEINSVWVIATMDNVNTPLIWDSSKIAKFKFVWHDLTTFKHYNTENSFKDVLSLGKSSKFAGSKGAKYVLSSLTANAKSLYRILLSHQLSIMEEDPDLIKKPELRGTLIGSLKYALELKNLFQLCLEEFVASNEVSFRTMLHEFVEHKMCNLVKDDSGTEMVFIPFKMDELTKLLEEELLD